MIRSTLIRLSLIVATLLMASAAKAQEPWTRNISRPYPIGSGLDGNHVALWASHGRYYDTSQMRWRWQRPSLYCTTEDLFTQTIVVPYLIPMLENAGAVVFTPRERDWQRHEVIVDNDQRSPSSLIAYQEKAVKKGWEDTKQPGFAMHDGPYHDNENPFEAGTARMATATKKKKVSIISYQPDIPEEGRYAVYVSYQTLRKSVPDAHYTVWHKGEKTEFSVNQRMGGGTWVYLGTFDFDKGCNMYNRVELSNQSQHSGVVTADAVRFGGGMGNIDRGTGVSGMPRCLEGARYYAQWAGMPYSVYSTREGTNDYADDINARSLMVNELCGGSSSAPDSTGRGVPFDVSLAVHSDAGYNKPDGTGIYGTLTICTTQRGDSTLGRGQSRQQSYDLAAQLLDNTTIDLQKIYRTWASRDLYDRNYSETRLPVVPSAIIETMSHQNFGDMRYGQDPNFRFSLARSIYKTLLRYINNNNGKHDVTVTPLAPVALRTEFTEKEGELRLSWTPTYDKDEPTAQPTSYIIYTAVGQSGFDNGQVVASTSVVMNIKPGVMYSFRVAALNNGGCSFPSETVTACYQDKKAPTVLVVGGFHRLSSPTITYQGFDIDDDIGVSYGPTCGWLGRQQVFDVDRIGIESSTGLGYSSSELAGKIIAGNDFNYIPAHAEAIMKAGRYNIVSCSKEGIKHMPTYKYNVIDLILGLERNDGHSLVAYKTFTPELQSALSQFTGQGGNVLVSGAYVASDMQANDDERRFLSEVLKCQYVGESRTETESVEGLGMTTNFYRQLNETHYAAPRTDIIMPTAADAFPAMAYGDHQAAAIAYGGQKYHAFVMGYPFECIKSKKDQAQMMKGILNFLIKR